MEFLYYIAESFSKAWNKSWSLLGMGINIGLSLFLGVSYFLAGLPVADARSLLSLAGVFLFTFVIYVVWELQTHFPEIVVATRNTMDGAEIVIFNNEIVDLTDLEVELAKRQWISRSFETIPANTNPSNRLFNIEGEARVSYDGGSKTVLIGSGQNETATFHFKVIELDTGFENYDGADHSAYDVILKIKGKIKGRSIFPRKVKGKLKYMRAPQEFPMYVQGRHQIIHQVYSRMEWEKPDHKLGA